MDQGGDTVGLSKELGIQGFGSLKMLTRHVSDKKIVHLLGSTAGLNLASVAACVTLSFDT